MLNLVAPVGCMIVELLDYRLQKNKEPALENPERTRAVLHPNSETLWADICSLNQRHGGKWTDHDALEVEALTLVSLHLHHSQSSPLNVIPSLSSPPHHRFAWTPIRT